MTNRSNKGNSFFRAGTMTMVFAVLFLVSFMPETQAMQVNQPNRDKTLDALLSQMIHPIVRQGDSSGEGEGEEEESKSNNSNPLSFPFQDYSLYEKLLRNGAPTSKA